MTTEIYAHHRISNSELVRALSHMVPKRNQNWTGFEILSPDCGLEEESVNILKLVSSAAKPQNWYLSWCISTSTCWMAFFHGESPRPHTRAEKEALHLDTKWDALLQRGAGTSCSSTCPPGAQASPYLTYWWLCIPGRLASSLQGPWCPNKGHSVLESLGESDSRALLSKRPMANPSDIQEHSWSHTALVLQVKTL